MTEYRPFIDDPAHLALLEGHRYVVLRPDPAVCAVYAHVQSAVRAKLSGLPVSYPAQAHLTLTGFPQGTVRCHNQPPRHGVRR